MMRNLPPKGVAGLALTAVRSSSLLPLPPAMIIAIVLRVRRLTKRPDFFGFIAMLTCCLCYIHHTFLVVIIL